jgi:hypothetical protein
MDMLSDFSLELASWHVNTSPRTTSSALGEVRPWGDKVTRPATAR